MKETKRAARVGSEPKRPERDSETVEGFILRWAEFTPGPWGSA